MPISLRMPPVLRPQVGGARQVEVAGATLREALDDLFAQFPAVRDQIVDAEGQINRFVNVYVSNEDVRLGQGLDTPVPDGSTVIILPAMAGGSVFPPNACCRGGGDVLSAIGGTPLVELPNLRPHGGARIWSKLEMLNPSGSIKDRVALSLIESAEAQGLLSPGQTIIEPTSGNTGIALAMICAVKGYKFRAVMPESATPERVQQISMYGAEIVFSPGELGSNGGVALARELAAADPSLYMPFQYANPENPNAHYRTTGPEIIEALDGQVDAFVAGLGTGGTLMGTGRALREANPDVQIIAAEPLQGESVMGLRSLEDGYTPEILDITQLDRKLLVTNTESVQAMRDLLRHEGIWVGVSCGAAFSVARRVAADLEPDQNVVTVFADGGARYASANLFNETEGEDLEELMEDRLWW
jgi:[CysO sulfur-carrier protein]-thiocarboxylate-dependent cysteine synthase